MISVILLCLLELVFLEAIVLTKEDFDVSVKEGIWFVKFYTGWCPHCKKLLPVWDDLSDVSLEADDPFYVGKVNCESEKKLCNEKNVNGYPTLLLFNEGDFIGEYYGKRTVDDFTSFVKRLQTIVEFGGELKVLDEKRFDEEVMYRNKWIVGCLPNHHKEREKHLKKWKEYAKDFKGSKIHLSVLDVNDVTDLKRYLKLPKDCKSEIKFLYVYKNKVNEIGEDDIVNIINVGVKGNEDLFMEEYEDGKTGMDKPVVRYLKAQDHQNRIKKYLWIVMIVFGVLFFVFLILAIVARKQGWDVEDKME